MMSESNRRKHTPYDEPVAGSGWYLLRRQGQRKWTLVWSTSTEKRLGYEVLGPYISHQAAKAAAYEEGGGLVGDTEQGPGPRTPLSG